MKSIQEEIKKVFLGHIEAGEVQDIVDLFKSKWLEMIGEDETYRMGSENAERYRAYSEARNQLRAQLRQQISKEEI